MSRRDLRRAAFASTVALALASLALVPATTSSAAVTSPTHHRVTLVGTKAPWATPSRAVGAPRASSTLSIRVGLKLRHAAAVERLARKLTTPGSRAYGHYLTPRSFNARFAPTSGSVADVRGYLTGAGLKVTGVAQGNRWVTATGSVAQLESAFHTSLRYYRHGRQTLRSPSADISLPTSVARVVQSVSGLAQGTNLRRPMTQRIAPDNRSTSPSADRPPASQCSDYWGQYQQTLPLADGHTSFNTYICGYTPSQLRRAYGTSKLISHHTTGRGVSVAIIDAYGSPTMLSDANQYSAAVAEPGFATGQYSETLFQPFNLQDECGGEAGWNSEQTLDVEAVHGMAPGANVHYIGAQNCDTGIDDALNYVVQNHVADIVSNSYGYVGEEVDPNQLALEHSIYVQAACEGIGMYFSSGDDGDNVINGLTPQPDYSSSDPLVTGVGGTSLLLNSNNRTVQETGWETSLDFVDYTPDVATYESPVPGDFYFGAGGGTSTLFKQPRYQHGVVPTSLATVNGPQPMRVAPDISADGDPYTGFYIGETVDGVFGISSIGGTSLSCPLVAGIQAVASQHRRHPIGFANPLLYSLPRAAYQDVVPHRTLHYASVAASYLGTFNVGSTQRTARGYDNITGRGTPNGAILVRLESAF